MAPFQECDYLRAIALPRLHISTVVDAKTGKVCRWHMLSLCDNALSSCALNQISLLFTYSCSNFTKPYI